MIRTRRKSIRDDITESWLTDIENRNVELSELIKTTDLSDLSNLTDLNDLSDLILSIAICWYCEISATWLIEKQNRDVESYKLIEITNLNDLNRLIDDLIELYFFAFVSDEIFWFWRVNWNANFDSWLDQWRKICLERNMRISCILIDWETDSRCRIETIDENIRFDRFDRCRIWLINKLEIINDLNLIKHRKKRRTHFLSYCI